MLQMSDAVLELLSVTLIVKLAPVAAAVPTPTIPAVVPVGKYEGMPSVRSTSPAGSEPLVIDQVYPPVPPVAVNGI
jgi:hypothetical protein